LRPRTPLWRSYMRASSEAPVSLLSGNANPYSSATPVLAFRMADSNFITKGACHDTAKPLPRFHI
jgi:hypothetical protein